MNSDGRKTDSFCHLNICLKALLTSRILRLWTKNLFSFLLPHSKMLQEHLPDGVMLTWTDPAVLSSTESRAEGKVCISTVPSSNFRRQVFILPPSSPLGWGWLSLLASWPCTFDWDEGGKQQVLLSNSGATKDCWGMNTRAERPKLQVMVVYNREGDLEALTLRVKAPQGEMVMVHSEEDRQCLSPPWVWGTPCNLGKKRAMCRDEVTQQTQRQS